MSIGRIIRLKSCKNDYMHRPDSEEGKIVLWDSGIGNEWIVEERNGGKIYLRSWKLDWLHKDGSDRPEVATYNLPAPGNEWIVEPVGDTRIRLKSQSPKFEGRYLYRSDNNSVIVSADNDDRSIWTVEELFILRDYQLPEWEWHNVRLFPFPEGGEKPHAIFSMYLVPGNVTNDSELENFITFMKENWLGNGFDPGPDLLPKNKSLFDKLAEKGWPAVIYPDYSIGYVPPESLSVLESMDKDLDKKQLFTAIQFGEWGYHFHNNPPSWTVKGYYPTPVDKKQCYDMLKEYFIKMSHRFLGRVISVTGHSHYEAYAGEWGARCIGLEIGENIAFTQSKLTFARGASKRWGKPWSVQVSPWFAGECTTSEHPDYGHSFSLYKRMWLHAWFAGTAMVTPENSCHSFITNDGKGWKLTGLGQEASKIFTVMMNRDRGVPYIPVAIVIDSLAGYNAYEKMPWGVLKPTGGDNELLKMFNDYIYSGGGRPREPNEEEGFMVSTPYGEIFDVLLTNVPAGSLKSYHVILLAGDINFKDSNYDAFFDEMAYALSNRTRILISRDHLESLKNRIREDLDKKTEYRILQEIMEKLADKTLIEVLDQGEEWTYNKRFKWFPWELLPVIVTCDPDPKYRVHEIQYQINRNKNGWVVELVNNLGVTKRPKEKEVVDNEKKVRVNLEPLIKYKSINTWIKEAYDNPLSIEIGPGESEFVEFVI